MQKLARSVLLVFQALVAVSAIVAGAFFIVGPLLGWDAGGPPVSMLEGSPFDSYLVPGVILLAVVGGTQTLALVQGLSRARFFPLFSAIAGYGLLIWIFVQVFIIPFSVLQVILFAIGLAEVGLVLLLLDIFRRVEPSP